VITPEPVAGQRGTDWMRWLASYAAAHATTVAQWRLGKRAALRPNSSTLSPRNLRADRSNCPYMTF
jgi:hypothetical protein